MFEGPQEELTRTENAQPAILTTSIALLRVLETEQGLDLKESCRFALGHSLGEYSALVATRALSLADAVRLVVRSPWQLVCGKTMLNVIFSIAHPLYLF